MAVWSGGGRMSLQARTEALNGRLTTLDTLAAVHALRRSRLTTEAKGRSGRALAKYEAALAAADADYFPRAAEIRSDVAEFARDAFQAGHGVTALLRLIDASGHKLPEAIAAARVELRLIALAGSVAKPDGRDWQENTTKNWAAYFAVTARTVTEWAQSRDWIKFAQHGRYRVDTSHPEPAARRLEVEKKRK